MTESRWMKPATTFVAGLWLATGCVGAFAQVQSPQQLANPASQNCVARGGTIKIERRPDGGQFGVCVFTDNYQCEEWAMFRGECPTGGLRVTGYITPGRALLRHHGRPLYGGSQERRRRRAGCLRAAGRQGLRCRRLLRRHLRPVKSEARDRSEEVPRHAADQLHFGIGLNSTRRSSASLRSSLPVPTIIWLDAAPLATKWPLNCGASRSS